MNNVFEFVDVEAMIVFTTGDFSELLYYRVMGCVSLFYTMVHILL